MPSSNENLILALFVALPVGLGAILVVAFRVYRLHRQPGIGRLVLGNLLVFLFLISLAMFTGELYLRFFRDTTDAFVMSKMCRRWFSRHFQFNDQSWRDSVPYELTSNADHRRLSFIGDSFTVGHGISNVEDRFVNRVRASLKDRKVDVHCLANCGWDTVDHLQLMQKIAPSNYELDLVVLVSVLNDIGDLVPDKVAADKNFSDRYRPGFLARSNYLFNEMYFYWVIARDVEYRNYDYRVAQGYHGNAWDAHRLRLQDFQRAIESKGGRLVVVTFPYVHALGTDNPFVGAHERLAEFWKSQGVPYLDLLPVFESSEPGLLVVGRRDAHPNERAHEIAAEAITNFLSPFLSSNNEASRPRS